MKHPGTFQLKVENICSELFTTADITASADGSHNAGALQLTLKSEPAGTDRYSITQKSPGSFKLTVKECVRDIVNNEFSATETIITAAAADKGVTASGMITEIVLPSTLRSIGKFGFAYHNSVSETLTIPRNVETLADEAFRAMAINSLTTPPDVVFEAGSRLRSIGNSAFLNSRLKDFTLPENLETIESLAFFNTRFTDFSSPGLLIIPSKVSRIGNSAFSGVNGITTVDIRSDQLRKPTTGAVPLGDALFQSTTGITEIKLPRTVYNSYLPEDRSRIFGTITLTPVP